MSMLQTALRSIERCAVSKAGELFRVPPPSSSMRNYSHQTANPHTIHYRYVIKDKSANRNLNNYAIPSGRRRLAENKYVLRKANLEKKKCFERIEIIQKQCGFMRKKNSVSPCTSYDPESPTLWMTVKNMYDTTRLFTYPRPYVDRLFES